MTSSSPHHQKFWERQVFFTTLRVNVGWILDIYLPVCLIISFFFSGLILLSRQFSWEGFPLFTLAITLLVGAFFISVWKQRNKFWTSKEGRVQLESHLNLNTQLSLASEGKSHWPPPISELKKSQPQWQLLRISWPVFCSITLLLVTLWIPITAITPNDNVKIEEPRDLKELTSWLDTLKKEDFVQEEAIEVLEKKLNDLKQADQKSWYSESHLEASEHLRKHVQQGIHELSQNLQKADDAISHLAQKDTNLSNQNLNHIGDQLGEAIKGLELGTIPLNKELLKSLNELNKNQAQSMSPDQLKQLQKNLKKGTQTCRQCLGDGTNVADFPGSPEGQKQYRKGSGKIARGPGSVPLTLKRDETQLETKKVEGIKSNDYERAMLGDVTGVSVGNHQSNQSTSQLNEGGNLKSIGKGGEAIWKNNFTPEEKKMLQRYFK